MANPADDLANAVLAFIESGQTDKYGLATAYSWYKKQCGEEVDFMALVKESENG